MIIANCSHTIIKNLFGKETSGIEDILNLYGKNLFIYSVILYSGNRTVDSTFILYISKNGVGFHGIVFGKRTILNDMYLVRKSKSVSNTFLFCLQKDDNLEL